MSDSFGDSSKKEEKKKPPEKPVAKDGPKAEPAPAATPPKPTAPVRQNPMAGKVPGAYKPPVKPEGKDEKKDDKKDEKKDDDKKEEDKKEEKKEEPKEPVVVEMTDTFQRNRVGGTGRLGDGQPRTHSEMVVRLEVVINALHPLITQLGPKVEVMRRAFQNAGHEIPGVPKEEFKFELTPRTTKIVAYLTTAIKKTQGLARQMALAIFRFHDAIAQIEKANRAIERRDIPPTMAETLSQCHFYLTNYHEEFKHEPVLTQLFPPPAGSTPGGNVMAATQEVAGEMQRALEEARKTLLKNSELLLANAAPRIEVILSALNFMDQVSAQAGALKPGSVVARVMSLQFIGDQVAITKMKKAVGYQEKLAEALKKIEAGSKDLQTLQIIYEGYVEMVQEWDRDHPTLREHLPLAVLPGQAEPEASTT